MNLVLSMAAGYDFEKVRFFTETFHTANVDADIVFFITEHENSFREAQNSFPRLKYVLIDPPFQPGSIITKIGSRLNAVVGKVRNLIDKTKESRRSTMQYTLIPHCWRYIIANLYLESLEQKPQQVMLADSRDVYFQANPFLNTEDVLVCGRESQTIFSSHINYTWAKRFLSSKEIEQIQYNVVSCSGVTYGSYNKIKMYIDIMEEEFLNRLLRVSGAIADQALHNWIVYSRTKALNVKWADNGDEHIYTAGTSLGREVRIQGLTVHTLDGQLVDVVHQLFPRVRKN